jgi:hypothetical protein
MATSRAKSTPEPRSAKGSDVDEVADRLGIPLLLGKGLNALNLTGRQAHAVLNVVGHSAPRWAVA